MNAISLDVALIHAVDGYKCLAARFYPPGEYDFEDAAFEQYLAKGTMIRYHLMTPDRRFAPRTILIGNRIPSQEEMRSIIEDDLRRFAESQT